MSTEQTKEQLYAKAAEVRQLMRQHRPLTPEWTKHNSHLLSITVAIANLKAKE